MPLFMTVQHVWLDCMAQTFTKLKPQSYKGVLIKTTLHQLDLFRETIVIPSLWRTKISLKISGN